MNTQFKIKPTSLAQQWLLKTTSWIMLFSILHLQTSCFQDYYRANTVKEPSAEKIEKFKEAPNYVIIHQGEKAWRLSSITINQDEGTIIGELSDLPIERFSYINTQLDGKPNRYFKRNTPRNKSNSYVLDEVHIFLKENGQDISSGIISITEVDRIDVYDPHVGATTASYLIGTIGAIAGALVVLTIIVLLTKDSCPFVYIHNGESYEFVGEIYSGAIYGCLERDDYMVLPKYFTEENNIFTLSISNKLKEKQYTNLTKLIYVSHPENIQIIPDKYGVIHSISAEHTPLLAMSNELDVTESIQRKNDESFFIFNNKDKAQELDDIILSFERPQDVDQAKLILTAKNSMWGDYVFGEFTKYFGNYYKTWINKQRDVSPDEHLAWQIEQGLTLNVYMETENGWQYVDYFNIVGPLSFRDIVLSIDISNIKGDTFKIKIEGGFMLWELDYAAIDFSPDSNFDIHSLEMLEAKDIDGKDVSKYLTQTDRSYLKQFNIGDEAILKFSAPTVTQEDYTLILHTRGFYEHIRDYKGYPNREVLESFRTPGAFSLFSKEKLDELQQMDWSNIKLMVRNDN
jgi:hypothetical protein